VSDGVVELQKAMQYLGIAHNAYKGSQFAKIFATRRTPEMTDEQYKTRLMLLRLLGQLIDTELEESMDKLVTEWLSYKKAVTGG